jgi:hypothetical protein
MSKKVYTEFHQAYGSHTTKQQVESFCKKRYNITTFLYYKITSEQSIREIQ